MVIAALQYGLGNQLFEYATARAVAERLRAPLFLDTTHYAYILTRELDVAKLNIRGRFLPLSLAKLLTQAKGSNPLKTLLKAMVGSGIHTLNDREQGYDPRIERLSWFSRLNGLWQSERYFSDLRPQLLQELEPREPLPTAVRELIQRVAQEPSVALHIRRGDLAADPGYAETVGTLGVGYYEDALSRIKSRWPNARGYVFSDDPVWCEQYLPAILPTEIVSGRLTHSAIEDFAAMKACRHFIIANSTFSWWTAWLGTHPDKRVFSPARFFRVPRAWEVDLLPSSWEKIDPAFVSPI